MKKIIICTILCMLCAVSNAQLVVKYESTDKTEKVCSVRPTYSHVLYNTELGYTLFINSSNRFDDPFSISLGEDKETAIETLNLLINVGENSNKISANSSNELLNIRGESYMGIKAIFISGNKHAGDCSLNVSELKKVVTKVQNYKEP